MSTTVLALGVAWAMQAAHAGPGTRLCRQAYARDDQGAWTRVLERAPDAECAEVARTRLEQLSGDLRACSDARTADTLDAWVAYSMAHPTGECGLEAVTEIKMREARGETRTPEPASEPEQAPMERPAALAHAEVEVVRAEGGLDAGAVRRMFGPGQEPLLRCYLDSAESDTRSEVGMALVIGAEGQVTTGGGLADVQSETWALSPMSERPDGLPICVGRVLQGLTWPTSDESTEVELTVRFAPSGSR